MKHIFAGAEWILGIILIFTFHTGICGQSFRWGCSLPEGEGFSTQKLYTMRDSLAAHNTTSLLIIRKDKILLEWYADGWSPERKHYTASLAKALVGGMSLALGLSDGRLQVDDRASKFIPEWSTDPQKAGITIRQLATHSAGLEDAEMSQEELAEASAKGIIIKDRHMDMPGWKGDFWRRDPDPFTVSRDKAPVLYPPGTSYHYSNTGMAMLAYAVTASYKGTGCNDIRTLLRERIMQPVGIRDSEWEIGYGKTYDVAGLDLVANWGGGSFTPRAVARIGRLMLDKGNWDGKQLIDSAWAQRVVQYAGTPLPYRDEKTPEPACGLAWYNNFDGIWSRAPRDLFLGAGAGNQILIVIPSLDMIIVRNGENMFDPEKGEGFYHGIVNYLVNPLMDAFEEPPYPKSEKITGIRFAAVPAIIRKAEGSDNWPMTWADDGNQYTAYGDGWGFKPGTGKKLSLGLAEIVGGPDDFEGINIYTKTGEQIGDGRKGKKASSMLMADGILYMWIRNAGENGEGSQLAWSSDHGNYWNYADWKFTASFGYPVFLNYGENYKGARDNYVYIYSPDANDAYKPSDRMVLARVARDRIRDLAGYEFFNYVDKSGNPVWSKDINHRGAVFINPAKCCRSGITYDEGLKRYLWCQIIPESNHPQGPRFQGGFGIYESPEPWGPWHTVFYTRDWDVGPGETSSFPSKWMSTDGKTCYLVFSGNDCFSVRKVEFLTK